MDGLMMRRHTLLARPLASPLTVSGPTPLLMPGAVAKPMRAATFAISPVQSGSGDPSPSNVRPITGWTGANCYVTGANLFDEEWESGAISNSDGQNIASSNSIRAKNFIAFKPGISKITISWDAAETGSVYALAMLYKSDKTFSRYYGAFTKSGYVFAVNADEEYLRFYLYNKTTPIVNCMVNHGITASPYTPYSGTTVSVEFPALGKNLYSGELNQYFPLNEKSGTTLCISGEVTGGQYAVFRMYDSAYTFKKSMLLYAGTGITWNSFTLDTDISYGKFEAGSGVSVNSLMIETGRTIPTAYEPYTNTVYSGTIDPVTGEGVVTHKCVTFDGSDDETIKIYSGNRCTLGIADYVSPATSVVDSITANYLKTVSKAGQGSGLWLISGSDTLWPEVMVNLGLPSVAEIKAYFAEHPLQIVYPLATPIPFTIPPKSLTPPAGDAYIWADCGGSAEVTYMGKA